MSASDFLRRDNHPASDGAAVPARPAPFRAQLSGIVTTPAELQSAYDAVNRQHDAILNITYLLPDVSRANAKLLLSFDSKTATWRHILDLFRNHFFIYHGVVVPDHCIMLIFGKSIMPHRRNTSRLFFFDIISPAYADGDNQEASLQLFVAIVGRGFTHAIDGTPARGLVVIRGEEKNLVACLVTDTVNKLGSTVLEAGVELFLPSSDPANIDADRLAYPDEARNVPYPSGDGETVRGAPLDARVFLTEAEEIPHFHIRRHTIPEERRNYYLDSAAFEVSYEAEMAAEVGAKRRERDDMLRQLEATAGPARLRAQEVLADRADSPRASETSDSDNGSTESLGKFDMEDPE